MPTAPAAARQAARGICRIGKPAMAERLSRNAPGMRSVTRDLGDGFLTAFFSGATFLNADFGVLALAILLGTIVYEGRRRSRRSVYQQNALTLKWLRTIC